ncbi:hypothetical protein OSC27_13060 [Microbacterium sp. STN6]|uniref:hypothetical protein n=1 Tax=Microbacterium sp. STN6 TaxID=2995588 RepID=UPI002260F866|nr:hypothetical protein [Microbacterium sp. STN6]MCX7523201.1 hypothetical protein [Microbacterium sp. STN6]
MSESAQASSHRAGVVLDAIGGALVAIAVAMITAQAIGVTWASRADAAASDPSLASWVSAAADNTLATPGIILLLAMCALIPGELLRRGGIGAGRGEPRGTLLPQGSLVAVFRPIGLGVHAAWMIALVVVSLTVTFLAAFSASSGTWPASVEHEGAYTVLGSLLAYGLLLVGVAGATLGSFVKKSVYASVVRRRGEAALSGAPGQAFWAWFTLRWRFDLWLCGVGLLVLAASSLPLSSGDAGVAVAAIVAGAALLAIGLWAACNYWRAGAPLGVGESFA